MFIRDLLYTLFTLYMLAILAVWLGPYIDFDLRQRKWSLWIVKIVDPLIQTIRKNLPYIGPFNWAPIIALLIVWLMRKIIVGI